MKKLKVAVLAITLIGFFGTSSAIAAATATIDVSATVLGSCSFDTGSYSMDFGTIDPATDTGDVTADVTLLFTCSNGTEYTLDDEGVTAAGAKTMSGAVEGDTMAYSIDDYTLTGTGNGLAGQSITITGRIAETAYTAAIPDEYTDQFTIDINP